jgi:hypothetical protein
MRKENVERKKERVCVCEEKEVQMKDMSTGQTSGVIHAFTTNGTRIIEML